MHEAAVAVLQIAPEKFFEFSAALFTQQTEYFDVNVVKESRNQTYARLAKLADSVGVPETKVLALLEVSDKPSDDGALNTGNGVTNDLKLLVKVGCYGGLGLKRGGGEQGLIDRAGESFDRCSCHAHCLVQCEWFLLSCFRRDA